MTITGTMIRYIPFLVACGGIVPAMAAAPSVRFEPSRIAPDEGYVLHIDLPDGTLLDYELRHSPLDLSTVTVYRGPWGAYAVRERKVAVPGGQGFTPGFYLARFKPRGAPEGEFSAFGMLMVDTLPVMNEAVRYGDRTVLQPPAGSYMIYQNRDAEGRFLGYTRIEIESDPCELGGATWRFSKTAIPAYWNAGGNTFLRWCVGHEDTPAGRLLLSPGGRVYWSGGIFAELARTITVSYEGNGMEHPATQGLLGGYAPDSSRLDAYHRNPDMWMHYALLPPGDRVPADLSDRPVTIVEYAFGFQSTESDDFLDTWHMEVLAPSDPQGAMRVRYIETGVNIQPDRIEKRWSVTEDWHWRADGIVSRIVQWADVVPMSWRGTYRSTTSGPLQVEAEMIEWWIPTPEPLTVRVSAGPGGTLYRGLSVAADQPYTLRVHRRDGRPYSGFLEVTRGDGASGVFRDRHHRPIYVSGGMVTIGAGARGETADLTIPARFRPFLAHSRLNSLVPLDPAAMPPNASTAAYSDPVRVSTERSPADADDDGDVDEADFEGLWECLMQPEGGSLRPACTRFDFDLDGRVSPFDFHLYQKCFSGHGRPADPACIPDLR